MRKSAVQSGAWNAHKEFAAINRATTIGDKTEQGIVAAPVHGESDVWNDWLELVAASPAAPDSSASAASSSSSTGQPTSWQEVDDRLDEQLLSTKFFVPSSSSALIPRPRLTRLLDEGIGCPLTLVSAPAGFGKTTLLSAWVHALQEDHPRVAWVSLDEGDNDLVRFWTYVLTALDHVQPGRYRELVSYLHTQQSPPVQSILTALINRLVEQTEQVVLVLDDYHLITEQAIHRALSYLLDHLPPQLRVILSSRSDPPLPLARLRACGQVLEVRTDQLRCTLEEARVFLREVMGLTLADQELEEVAARSCSSSWNKPIYSSCLWIGSAAGIATTRSLPRRCATAWSTRRPSSRLLCIIEPVSGMPSTVRPPRRSLMPSPPGSGRGRLTCSSKSLRPSGGTVSMRG